MITDPAASSPNPADNEEQGVPPCNPKSERPSASSTVQGPMGGGMKKITDQISLAGKDEQITIMDWRKQPGEVLSQVALGKTFLITKNGQPVAILSKPPGETLGMTIDSKGKMTYDTNS
jgi:hypothetical protein